MAALLNDLGGIRKNNERTLFCGYRDFEDKVCKFAFCKTMAIQTRYIEVTIVHVSTYTFVF